MAEIIDTLSFAVADSNKFTVNTAVTNLPLIEPGAAIPKPLVNAGGGGIFQAGDSFSILSAGLYIPEGFTLYKDPAVSISSLIDIKLFIKDTLAGTFFDIDVLNPENSVYIEMENFEMALDVFCDVTKQLDDTTHTTLLKGNFGLVARIINLKISMLGIPALYNGKTFFVSPFFKILHNLPLMGI
jgi:hypothetical protein